MKTRKMLVLGALVVCGGTVNQAVADSFRVRQSGRFLDIDGRTGAVVSTPYWAPGAEWQVRPHNGFVTLQVTARGAFRGCYLDIDGRTGKLMLSRRLEEGAKWRIVNVSGGGVALQNVGQSRFRFGYLDLPQLKVMSTLYTGGVFDRN